MNGMKGRCLFAPLGMAAAAAHAEVYHLTDQDPASGRIEVLSGGAEFADALKPDCEGWTSRTIPILVLDRAGSGGPPEIPFSEGGGVDMTLVVETPTGEWRCSDFGRVHQPVLFIDKPAAGEFRVHVGTCDPVAPGPPATLGFALLNLEGRVSRDSDMMLQSGFAGAETVRTHAIAGGLADVSTLQVEGCVGFVSSDSSNYALA